MSDEKKPRLLYYEKQYCCWTFPPPLVEELVFPEGLEPGEEIEIRFKMEMMTDAEVEALLEVG